MTLTVKEINDLLDLSDRLDKLSYIEYGESLIIACNMLGYDVNTICEYFDIDEYLNSIVKIDKSDIKTEKISFEDFNYGERFRDYFKRTFSNMLLKQGFSNSEIDNMWNVFNDKIEPLNSINEMVTHFVMKEDLNDDISKYEEVFGLENITLGKIYMDNLSVIYKRIMELSIRDYKVYEENFMSKLAKQQSQNRSEKK